MKNSKANRETVFHAAELLFENGIKPTTEKIREQLTGGSQSTIHKYLLEWRKIKDLTENVHIKKQNSKISDLVSNLENFRQENDALIDQITALKATIATQTDEILYLKTINNAYATSTNSALDFFNAKMQDMQANFDSAVSILSKQVQLVINSSWQELQSISHAYQDKLVDSKMQSMEQQFLARRKNVK